MGKARAKKRAHGEGSVYQDARGFWRGAITLADGKRKYFSAPTRAAAAAKVQSAATAARAGQVDPDGRALMSAYLADWLEGMRPRVAPRTHAGYSMVFRCWVLPSLASKRLMDLTPRHVTAMMGDLAARGLAPSVIARARNVLSQALGDALKAGMVSRNVASMAAPPRQRQAERVWLDAAQASAFLAAAAEDPDGTVMALTLLLGLRAGEVQGLRWSDYSPERGVLDIRRTVWRSGGEWHEAPPKSAAGRRGLPVPAPAAELLAAERARQVATGLWRADGPLLMSPTGDAYYRSQLARVLGRVLAAAGLPTIRMHDLRHSTASILLEKGVPARVVADLLGHSNISITLHTYSHVTARMVSLATDAMGSLSPSIAAPIAAQDKPESSDNARPARDVAQSEQTD